MYDDDYANYNRRIFHWPVSGQLIYIGSIFKSLNESTVLFLSDETQSIIDPMFAPVESEHEDSIPPVQNTVRLLLHSSLQLNCHSFVAENSHNSMSITSCPRSLAMKSYLASIQETILLCDNSLWSMYLLEFGVCSIVLRGYRGTSHMESSHRIT